MSAYAVYDATTGEITASVNAPTLAAAQLQVNTGEALYTGEADDLAHYIDPATGARQDRQPMAPSVTTSTGAATVTGLPTVCTAQIHGQTIEVTDGQLDLTFDAPGTYHLRVEARPQYLDHETDLVIP